MKNTVSMIALVAAMSMVLAENASAERRGGGGGGGTRTARGFVNKTGFSTPRINDRNNMGKEEATGKTDKEDGKEEPSEDKTAETSKGTDEEDAEHEGTDGEDKELESD